ncbi:MAG: hypothetical protein ABI852_03985 [Gemmatimonadaceae bacterium]
MAEQLDPTGAAIEIEGITLRTPGLEGTAQAIPVGANGTRAAEETTQALEQAMANENLRTETSLELGDTNEVDIAQGSTRSTSFDEPAIEMEVDGPTAEWGQFVLASDESGVMTWNVAEESREAAGVVRGGSGTKRTYLIRRTVTQAESGPKTRGLIGAVGKKILKVVAFKLLDPIGGLVGDFFAGRWEAKKRPYRFRTFTTEDYNQPDGRILQPADWQKIGTGRALLMIHGTGSRTHGAFGSLSPETIATLHQRYDGRVFGFDHFTLSEDPRQNIEWFFRHLPQDRNLDVDIVCHSRGGLVSRLLSERANEFSLGTRTLNVNKIVFVAAPNSGTTLADPKYMNAYIDSYTNLLNFVPDTGIIEALEGLVTVVKQLAVGALKGLDGLQSMNPAGDFIKNMNVGPVGNTKYYALASNFEPNTPGFKSFAADRLTDSIFKANNDLVVPTDGVFSKNGRGGFPIDEKFVFDPSAGVGHTNFFAQKKTNEKILEWLS